jgi:hypothetical protein
MSDTKWRRVFAAIENHPELGIRQCVFKFLELDEERVAGPVVDFFPPRPWLDSMSFGPFPLRSIEWLLFPHKASYQVDPRFPPRFEAQDVEGARDVLDRLGKLPLEMTERGLLVRGYLLAK